MKHVLALLIAALTAACTNGHFILQKHDSERAHRCKMDANRPECSIN